jgi:hypothetical protein
VTWHAALPIEIAAEFRALSPSMFSIWDAQTPHETLEWKRTVASARERSKQHRKRKTEALAASGDLRALRRSESAKRAYKKRGKA